MCVCVCVTVREVPVGDDLLEVIGQKLPSYIDPERENKGAAQSLPLEAVTVSAGDFFFSLRSQL